mgnify:CR=1 FL=1
MQRSAHSTGDAMTPELIAALCGFAFLAGFVDAVVGGGGLIQVPALLVLLPQYPVATLFGTNKAASIWGTAVATWRYARHIQTPWRSVLPMALAALVAGFAGAAAVSHLDNALLKPVILVVLVVVLVSVVMLRLPYLPRRSKTRRARRRAVISSSRSRSRETYIVATGFKV